MKRIALLALIAVPGIACQQTTDTATKAESTVIEEKMQTATATVQSVDQATREITLKSTEGKIMTFRAGEEVKNLPQVKVGDKVRVNYYESIAARLLKPGEAPPAGETAMGGTAPQGEKPGAFARAERTVTAKIIAIDASYPSVTVRMPDGSEKTTRIRDKSNLKKIAVGDEVVLTYVEGMAIAVVPAD